MDKAHYQAEVDWWSFKRGDKDWSKTHAQNTNIGINLNGMTELGKLDVIKLKGAALTVIGDPNAAIAPSSVPIEKEKYLLTNGGFFDPKPALASRKPLGQTSLSATNWMPIPAQYKKYYAEL
ncbi:hypothetical protein E8E11_000126 [Didymella keratinophila]|nr:hypothetical protein E8E11_000126 [Didymella keratinophila]